MKIIRLEKVTLLKIMEFLYFHENSRPLVQNTCDRFSVRYLIPVKIYRNTNQALEQSANINYNNNNNNNKQMADKSGFVRRNRGLFNSNTGPSRTNKELQEIYFEAARHRWAMQNMWKRIGHNPTHYCSMLATSTYRVCNETWWTSQNYP